MKILQTFYFQETLNVARSDSDTSLILETRLSITSATTFLDMIVTTDAANPSLEPCLIYNSCNYCENDKCRSHIENYLKNGTRLQPINRYSSHLVYECGLARGFVMSGFNLTAQSIEMTCDWDPRWTPTSIIPECACKSKTARDL